MLLSLPFSFIDLFFVYLSFIHSFVIRSASENFFISKSSSSSSLIVTENVMDATKFYLTAKYANRPMENYIRAGPEYYLDTTFGGRAILRKPIYLNTIDSFKILITEKGSYIFQKDSKCLSYNKLSKDVVMAECDVRRSNIEFYCEGSDFLAHSMSRFDAFGSYGRMSRLGRTAFDMSSEEDLALKSELARRDFYRSDLIGHEMAASELGGGGCPLARNELVRSELIGHEMARREAGGSGCPLSRHLKATLPSW
jgi:hypothetical protein